jgi:hypothetical protein
MEACLRLAEGMDRHPLSSIFYPRRILFFISQLVSCPEVRDIIPLTPPKNLPFPKEGLESWSEIPPLNKGG